MASRIRRIVIAGAGQAGGRTAQQLRSQGFDGSIILVGDEAHAPYERPPLSKAFLTGAIEEVDLALAPTQSWRDLDVTFISGAAAVYVDRASRRIALNDGSSLEYDRLVVATGARARRLPSAVDPDAVIAYLRDIADASTLRQLFSGVAKRLCVIGAGVIGLEIAASARSLGLEVTVVERDASPLGRIVPAALGDWFGRYHEANGVAVRCGIHPIRVVPEGHGVRVHLSEGADLVADVVVAGIGVVPNVELLSDQGLQIEDGILTDAAGQSEDPTIFAVGDVARPYRPVLGRHQRLEAWRNAEEQPAAVVSTMLGRRSIYDAVPWMWSDQYDVNLQVSGSPLDADQAIMRRNAESEAFTVAYLRDGAIVGAAAVDRGREIRQLQSLIAAHACIDVARFADSSIPIASIRI